MAETKGEWPAIGIDLGTTYSCVAVWRRDRVEVIVNDQGNRTTPSCVAFTDADRLVGDAAKNQCHTNPTNTIFGVKRLIGRKYRDSYVQSHIKLWPFTVEEERNGDKPEIVVQYQGERKCFSTEEISSMILSKMKSVAEAFLGTAVTNAVITVPAYFNDSQRRSTRDAARLAGLDALRVINEPTAAAVAYGLDNSGHRKNLLIFDLGGGTFDVSILRMEGSVLQVKATAGDTSLGGEDFDERMVKHLVGEFKKKNKEDVSGNPKAMRRMRTACERAKRALSSTIDTFVELEYLHNGMDLTYRFTRAKFEELNMDMFEKCMDVVRKCLRDAKLQTGDVDEVVLVGGSTRIPKVQEMLRELFGGKEPCKSINPDEAVAYGAAVQAAKLAGAGQSKLNDLVLLDVIPLSLGTSTGDGEMSVIIPRNTPTPVKRMESYVTAHDNQPAVRVDVYEGERSMVADNNFLGEFIFGGLPRAPAGETTVTVAFAVDADGILSVSAENAETGKRQEVKISNESGRPTAAEVKRMLEEAERYRWDDEERRERAAARSRLGTYIANMRIRAREGRLGVKGTLVKVLEEKLEKASVWLMENQEAEAAEYERRRTKLELVFENVSSLSSLMGSLDLE